MSLSSWLSSPLLRSRAQRAKCRKPATTSPQPRHTVRPRLEALEIRLTPSLSTLASFDAPSGAYPRAALIMDSSGNLYGTTNSGGASSDGTIFELAHGSGTITTLATFNGTNGARPQAGLIMDGRGNLYGTAPLGGASSDGTVFELAHGSGTIITLASFNGTNGAQPFGGLIMDGSGNLYGTAPLGGADGRGTVFELAHGSGTITRLASFNGANGSNPYASLTMDSSGNLYGTTSGGGASADGTAFELAHGSGTITTLASFVGYDGSNPRAGLIMDSSGNLYGTTALGGPANDGTVFELAHGSGMITMLSSFQVSNVNSYAGLIMDSSGNLYGTTGGGTNLGTVFELVHGSGMITRLAQFNRTNGAVPYAGLIMDSSGNLYGTTELGGPANAGTVFELPAAAAQPHFQISGFPSSTSAGASHTFTVTVQNADGTTNTGYTGTVHFTSTDLQAVLLANYTFTAAGAGKHDLSVTLKTAGTQSITATDTVTSGLTSSQTGITVNPAAARVLVITGPSTATAGVAFSITVTAYDAYGNIATGYTGTVHFKSTDNTAKLPANYT